MVDFIIASMDQKLNFYSIGIAALLIKIFSARKKKLLTNVTLFFNSLIRSFSFSILKHSSGR
jgi:hypothetical protein